MHSMVKCFLLYFLTATDFLLLFLNVFVVRLFVVTHFVFYSIYSNIINSYDTVELFVKFLIINLSFLNNDCFFLYG